MISLHLIYESIQNMSINNDDDEDDNFFNEQLVQAQSLLQSGNKVFLQHTHKSGYLNPKSKWDGEYHLAHIAQSYNKSTNQCRVTWEREGYSQTVPYTLCTPTQIISAEEYVKNRITVQIEDDFNGQIHSGTIVDLFDGSSCNSSSGDSIVRSGEVMIKWDTGQKQIMCVSQVQVSVNIGRRKRRTVSKSKNEMTGNSLKKAVSSTTSKKMVDGTKQQCSDLSKTREKQKKKQEEVITIGSSSSSSSEDDEDDGQHAGDRKQKWISKKQTVHASSSSSSSDDAQPKTSGQKYDAGTESFDNNEGYGDSNDGDDEESVGLAKHAKRPSIIQVPRGSNPPRRTQTSASVEATNKQSASSDGASPRGDKDDLYSKDSSSSDESDVMSRRSLDTQEGAYESSTSWGKTFLGQAAEEERSVDKLLVKPPSKGAARRESGANSDSQSSSDDESEDEMDEEPRKMAAVQKHRTTTATSQSSDEDSDDSEKGGRPRTSVRKRKARDVAAAGSFNMVGKISAKRVTCKRDSILLNGFCRSLPEMRKKPHDAIEIVQEVLDKALECKESSDGKFDMYFMLCIDTLPHLILLIPPPCYHVEQNSRKR